MHKTMEKIEIIRSEEFIPSEARLKFLKKMIILVPKTAILGPQFCRILVLRPHFWWSGGPRPPGPPWIHPWCVLIRVMKINQHCFTKIMLEMDGVLWKLNLLHSQGIKRYTFMFFQKT